MIPNLINITLPFIVIFGLVLCFYKLDKDKEIIAIYSSGLGNRNIKNPLISFVICLIILYVSLNTIISPIIYNKYKINEFNCNVDYNKICDVDYFKNGDTHNLIIKNGRGGGQTIKSLLPEAEAGTENILPSNI